MYVHLDRYPDRQQNVNICSLGHAPPLQKIPPKSIHKFLSNLVIPVPLKMHRGVKIAAKERNRSSDCHHNLRTWSPPASAPLPISLNIHRNPLRTFWVSQQTGGQINKQIHRKTLPSSCGGNKRLINAWSQSFAFCFCFTFLHKTAWISIIIRDCAVIFGAARSGCRSNWTTDIALCRLVPPVRL